MALAVGAPSARFPARVVGLTDWAAVPTLARTVDGVVVLPVAGAASALCADDHPLRAVLAAHPAVPVVVVAAARDPAAAPLRARLASRGSVVSAGAVAVLWSAIQRAGATALLAESAETLEHAYALPRRLRRVLAGACRGPAPMTSVAACATAAGCHRRTLWREWRDAGVIEADLEWVLWWVTTLRARAARASGRPWAAVARDLGLDRTTLARIVLRALRTSLGELDTMPHAAVAEACRTALLRPLAGGGTSAAPAAPVPGQTAGGACAGPAVLGAPEGAVPKGNAR